MLPEQVQLTSVKTPPAAVKSMILNAAAEILTSDTTMNALVTSAINTANILSTDAAAELQLQPPAEPAPEPLAAMSHAVSQAVTQAVSQVCTPLRKQVRTPRCSRPRVGQFARGYTLTQVRTSSCRYLCPHAITYALTQVCMPSRNYNESTYALTLVRTPLHKYERPHASRNALTQVRTPSRKYDCPYTSTYALTQVRMPSGRYACLHAG
jgi:hypothetical protein